MLPARPIIIRRLPHQFRYLPSLNHVSSPRSPLSLLILPSSPHHSLSRSLANLAHRAHTSSMAEQVEIAVSATGKKLNVPTGLFINNKFVPSADSQEKIQSVPSIAQPLYTPEPLSSYPITPGATIHLRRNSSARLPLVSVK